MVDSFFSTSGHSSVLKEEQQLSIEHSKSLLILFVAAGSPQSVIKFFVTLLGEGI